MKKLNVAIFFGGCSPEYGVSLKSAYSVICNLNRKKYNPVLVGISRKGDWFYYGGDIEKIKNDTWQSDDSCIPAVLSQNKNERRLILQSAGEPMHIQIDVAFPILHGKNGEDGTVQGLSKLAGIPVAGCGILASAVCMDKDCTHKLAKAAGVHVPEAFVMEKNTPRQEAAEFALRKGYPLYVKPVKAGSSYGITKVRRPDELYDAIKLAFRYDDKAIIEENIDGFEVGCAVLGNERLITGEVDEIEVEGGFFDFTEKYTQRNSTIHVPARISDSKAEEIKNTAKRIYRALGCSGFARVDMFLTPEGEIVFNEVNTIPGFTEHSRYPGMMKAAGYSYAEIIEKIVGEAVEA